MIADDAEVWESIKPTIQVEEAKKLLELPPQQASEPLKPLDHKPVQSLEHPDLET
jgi:hypothetical protein